MDRLAQGVTNRAHRCTETEDQRIQDSDSQPHARFSTFFLRGTDEYRPVAAGTRRPQAAAAVSPRWRRPKQFSRPCGCICATRSFQLAVVVSFGFASHESRSLATSRLAEPTGGRASPFQRLITSSSLFLSPEKWVRGGLLHPRSYLLLVELVH